MNAGLATKQQALQAKSSNKKKKKEVMKTGEMTPQEKQRLDLHKQREAQKKKDQQLNQQTRR